jgi:hypothetical protein
MQVSGQTDAPAMLTLGKRVSISHWMQGWWVQVLICPWWQKEKQPPWLKIKSQSSSPQPVT